MDRGQGAGRVGAALPSLASQVSCQQWSARDRLGRRLESAAVAHHKRAALDARVCGQQSRAELEQLSSVCRHCPTSQATSRGKLNDFSRFALTVTINPHFSIFHSFNQIL